MHCFVAFTATWFVKLLRDADFSNMQQSNEIMWIHHAQSARIVKQTEGFALSSGFKKLNQHAQSEAERTGHHACMLRNGAGTKRHKKLLFLNQAELCAIAKMHTLFELSRRLGVLDST